MDTIPMTPEGEGRWTVDLGSVVVTLVTRYNYRTACWTMDVLDATGVDIVNGLMLLPQVDLLRALPTIKAQLGGTFAVYSKFPDSYTDPDSLGEDTQVVWIPSTP